MTYRASITFNDPSDGVANFKAQINAFGLEVSVAVPILNDKNDITNVQHARRKCFSIAARLVQLINETISE